MDSPLLLLVIFYLPFLPVFLMDRLKAIKHTSRGINSLPIQHRVGEILQPLHFMFTDDDNGHNSVGYTLGKVSKKKKKKGMDLSNAHLTPASQA